MKRISRERTRNLPESDQRVREGRYEITEATVPEDGVARNAAYYKAGIKIADECDGW